MDKDELMGEADAPVDPDDMEGISTAVHNENSVLD